MPRPFFVTTFAIRLSLLRWLDEVFHGKYFASLSINYVAVNKDLEKIATTVVLEKGEKLLFAMTSELS